VERVSRETFMARFGADHVLSGGYRAPIEREGDQFLGRQTAVAPAQVVLIRQEVDVEALVCIAQLVLAEQRNAELGLKGAGQPRVTPPVRIWPQREDPPMFEPARQLLWECREEIEALRKRLDGTLAGTPFEQRPESEDG